MISKLNLDAVDSKEDWTISESIQVIAMMVIGAALFGLSFRISFDILELATGDFTVFAVLGCGVWAIGELIHSLITRRFSKFMQWLIDSTLEVSSTLVNIVIAGINLSLNKN
jgi:hypothetical protein